MITSTLDARPDEPPPQALKGTAALAGIVAGSESALASAQRLGWGKRKS